MKNHRRVILLGPMFKTAQDRAFLRRILPQLKIKSPGNHPKGSLEAPDRLIGVDSGTMAWLKLGYRPDLAVGDWDSVTTRERRRILTSLSHLVLSPDKDRSDFYHALQAVLQWVPEEIIALGLTGGRPDHHLAVLLDMMDVADEASQLKAGTALRAIRLLGPEAEYHFLAGAVRSWSGRLKKGKTVSLFSLHGAAQGVSLDGFEYALENSELSASSHGLSNVTLGTRQEVRIRKGRLLIVVPS